MSVRSDGNHSWAILPAITLAIMAQLSRSLLEFIKYDTRRRFRGANARSSEAAIVSHPMGPDHLVVA
jgi:hypothetical protein